MSNFTTFVGDGESNTPGHYTLIKFCPELGLLRLKVPKVIISSDGVTRIAIEDEE